MLRLDQCCSDTCLMQGMLIFNEVVPYSYFLLCHPGISSCLFTVIKVSYTTFLTNRSTMENPYLINKPECLPNSFHINPRDLIALPQGGLNPAVPQNKQLAAGWVVFGQLLSHDISSHRLTDAEGRPTLLLKSLYGAGPSLSPYLYVVYPEDWADTHSMRPPTPNNQQPDDYYFKDVKLRLRHKQGLYGMRFDVARDEHDIALMADCRNDQHFLLNQLHVALARFHNAVVDYLAYLIGVKTPDIRSLNRSELFRAARALTIQCYQEVILKDYLPRMIQQAEVLLSPDYSFQLFNPDAAPLLMPEFSDAALRMGHSQVSEEYEFPFDQRRYIFTEKVGRKDLRGYRDMLEADPKLYMDWHWFFDLGYGMRPQGSSAIDPIMVAPLGDMPAIPVGANNIAVVDALRFFSTCPGMEYATALLPEADWLTQGDMQHWPGAGSTPVIEQLPLWAYLMLEAQLKAGGKRLGPLGSIILAEQLRWVLSHDQIRVYEMLHNLPLVYQNRPDVVLEPLLAFMGWRSLAPSYTAIHYPDDHFGMQDLLEFPNYVERVIALHRESPPVAAPNPLLRPVAYDEEEYRPEPVPASTDPQNLTPTTYAPGFDTNELEAMFEERIYEGAENMLFYFSRSAIANRIAHTPTTPTPKEGVEGVTFTFGLLNSNLVLMAWATNDKQVHVSGTSILLSVSPFSVTIQTYASLVDALKNSDFQAVKDLTSGPAYNFDRQALLDLLFTDATASNSGNLTFTLYTGPVKPDTTNTSQGINLNLYVDGNSQARGAGYAFSHPKYCYYQ